VLILIKVLSSEHTGVGGRTAKDTEGIPGVRIVMSV
jgi:hypothetical protein